MSKLTIKGAGTREMYKTYKDRGNKTLGYTGYREVLYDINKEIVSEILKGRRVKIPYFGFALVNKYEQNPEKLCMDYKYFNETGEKRFITNFHSDGFQARIKWDKTGVTTKNLGSFTFVSCRDLKRSVAAQMKLPKGHIIYEESLRY